MLAHAQDAERVAATTSAAVGEGVVSEKVSSRPRRRPSFGRNAVVALGGLMLLAALGGVAAVAATPMGTAAFGSAYADDPLALRAVQEAAKLQPSDGEASEFGYCVALWGDTALVGAPGTATGGSALSGAAYVYRRSGEMWRLEQRLVASDGGRMEYFGQAVALRGDLALVGAPAQDSDADEFTGPGAAYIFTRSGSTWSLARKLSPVGDDEQASFGESSRAERRDSRRRRFGHGHRRSLVQRPLGVRVGVHGLRVRLEPPAEAGSRRWRRRRRVRGVGLLLGRRLAGRSAVQRRQRRCLRLVAVRVDLDSPAEARRRRRREG